MIPTLDFNHNETAQNQVLRCFFCRAEQEKATRHHIFHNKSLPLPRTIPNTTMSDKQFLAGKTAEELKAIAAAYGMPRFAASQIASWLYRNRVDTIDQMTNLSKVNREKLAADFEVGYTAPIEANRSADGTVKYLFAAGDSFIETVYIPDRERATLCVSSQVGCKMNCRFCMTGKQGFKKNLSATEIINQIVSVPEFETLTNIVFMGMGEPLDNTDEVLKALDILTSDYGFAWSPRRITLSTIGVTPNLRRFLDESQCHLAISLHNPFADERQELMPVQKAFPIAATIDLLRQYDFSHQRRLSFEYIVFEGINDSPAHINELAHLLHGLDCRINLIRFHAIPQVDLHSPSAEKMEAFRDALSRKGIICTIRASRGEDIKAACGMLSTARKESAAQ